MKKKKEENIHLVSLLLALSFDFSLVHSFQLSSFLGRATFAISNNHLYKNVCFVKHQLHYFITGSQTGPCCTVDCKTTKQSHFVFDNGAVIEIKSANMMKQSLTQIHQ